MLALVPSTQVPKRLTTGWLIKLLTSFARHTRSKRNRWLGAGGSDVGTLSWLPTSRMRRVRCLWCWISASPTKDSGVVLTLVLMDTCPPTLSPLCLLLLVRLGVYILNLCAFYSYRLIGKLTAFFAASGVQLTQSNRGQFHYRRAAFSSQLKAKVGCILAKVAALRINLNIDGAPIASKSHTHPSHSQTSRLSTSSLSLGVPVPRATQCMRGV